MSGSKIRHVSKGTRKVAGTSTLCVTRKVGFATRAKARRALLSKRYAQSPARRIYLCPHCGEWHVTKQTPRKKVA